MDGPAHYQKAEELLAWVENLSGLDEVSTDAVQIALAQAAAHATLALAAAQAIGVFPNHTSSHEPLDLNGWREALQ